MSAAANALEAVRQGPEITAEVIQSAGGPVGDPKDQDRARWHENEAVACVCDGLTTSPYSSQAAEYISNRAPRLFNDSRSVHAMAAHLRRRRRLAASGKFTTASPVPLPILLEVMKEKFDHSFQTTVIAIRVRSGAIDWKKVGDSDVVILGDDGRILLSTAFQERAVASSRTDAMPDHYRRMSSGSTEFTSGALAVIGSDGFFGAFGSAAEVRAWCGTRERGPDVAELHARLTQGAGDDDISAVILRVRADATS